MFVKDSISYDAVESAALFQRAARHSAGSSTCWRIFRLRLYMRPFLISDNTLWRYENEFLPAVEADKAGRAAAVQAEIQFVGIRKADTHRLSDLAAAGQLPLPVTP